MKNVYINSVGSVSAQKTFDNAAFLEEVEYYNDNVIPAINPNYKAYIPPAVARRMAKGVKMSTVASKTALDEARLENVDAIIVGTGLGCIGDSAKFVGAIIDNKEQFLTPTRFIQSSHNTVSGQIALAIGCKGYNFTYVNSSVSFESCLLDALLQIRTEEVNHILVGGVDELGDHHLKSHQLINHFKNEAVAAEHLLESKTKGCVPAEGANFFVLSDKQQTSTYAELVAVKTFNTLEKERIDTVVGAFLSENNLTLNEIDILILGNNGDIDFDTYYDTLSKHSFKNTQLIPEAVKLNAVAPKAIKTILLYNQYRGENHSLTLLRQC